MEVRTIGLSSLPFSVSNVEKYFLDRYIVCRLKKLLEKINWEKWKYLFDRHDFSPCDFHVFSSMKDTLMATIKKPWRFCRKVGIDVLLGKKIIFETFCTLFFFNAIETNFLTGSRINDLQTFKNVDN